MSVQSKSKTLSAKLKLDTLSVKRGRGWPKSQSPDQPRECLRSII